MKKKKEQIHFWQTWWFKMIVIPVILMPAVVMSWKNITLIWAGPDTDKKIEVKINAAIEDIDKQQETLDTLKDMYKEQKMEATAQKKIDAAQLEALKSIVEANRKSR